MYKKGFSYIEVILGMTILLLSIIPTMKLNAFQIKFYNQLELKEESSNFFDFVETCIKTTDYNLLRNYIGNTNISTFLNYKQLDFIVDTATPDKDRYNQLKYNINFKIVSDNIDYGIDNKECLIISLNMDSKFLRRNSKIIRFKEGT